jgi:hypothetical protein
MHPRHLASLIERAVLSAGMALVLLAVERKMQQTRAKRTERKLDAATTTIKVHETSQS